MADKDLEQDDPYELVAQRAPLEASDDPDGLVARCVVEEFAVMGMPGNRILQLFRSGAFAGTHSILEERGEAFVQGIIDSVFGSTGPSSSEPDGDEGLFVVPLVEADHCACGGAGCGCTGKEA